MGVQGCGKSLAVKVIAGELDLPLYQLDLTRLYSKYIGETEQNLRKTLSTPVGPDVPLDRRDRKELCRSRGRGRGRRRLAEGAGGLPHLDAGAKGPVLRGGHRQRRLPAAAGVAAQRAVRRHLLRRSAGSGRKGGHLHHPPTCASAATIRHSSTRPSWRRGRRGSTARRSSKW